MQTTSPAQEFSTNLSKSMEQMLSVDKSVVDMDAMFQMMKETRNHVLREADISTKGTWQMPQSVPAKLPRLNKLTAQAIDIISP